MDLDFLNAPLSPPGSMSGRELDAALDQIVTMAERNQFAQAGHAAAQLWKEHIYDARTIGVLLFAAFSEKGMAALGDIFAAAQSILAVHWPMIGPEPNRNRHADSSLRWLATSIISHFRFSQKLNPSEWQKLLRDWEGANQGLAFTQLAQLLSACEMPLPMGQAKASLSQLLKVLRECYALQFALLF